MTVASTTSHASAHAANPQGTSMTLGRAEEILQRALNNEKFKNIYRQACKTPFNGKTGVYHLEFSAEKDPVCDRNARIIKVNPNTTDIAALSALVLHLTLATKNTEADQITRDCLQLKITPQRYAARFELLNREVLREHIEIMEAMGRGGWEGAKDIAQKLKEKAPLFTQERMEATGKTLEAAGQRKRNIGVAYGILGVALAVIGAFVTFKAAIVLLPLSFIAVAISGNMLNGKPEMIRNMAQKIMSCCS